MKLFLALCLVVYFFVEVSSKPSAQSMDQASDLIERMKQKFQDALEKAQEAASGAVETVSNLWQNGLQFAQKSAQSGLEYAAQSGAADVKPQKTASA